MKKTIILQLFAQDYHSGQSSRLFRIMCKIHKRIDRNMDYFAYLRLMNNRRFVAGLRRTNLYKQLVAKYAITG